MIHSFFFLTVKSVVSDLLESLLQIPPTSGSYLFSPNFLTKDDNLRFGGGDLLKDGAIEAVGGRSLKGRCIVRVGWDDVRGWFSQVVTKLCVPMFFIGSTLS